MPKNNSNKNNSSHRLTNAELLEALVNLLPEILNENGNETEEIVENNQQVGTLDHPHNSTKGRKGKRKRDDLLDDPHIGPEQARANNDTHIELTDQEFDRLQDPVNHSRSPREKEHEPLPDPIQVLGLEQIDKTTALAIDSITTDQRKTSKSFNDFRSPINSEKAQKGKRKREAPLTNDNNNDLKKNNPVIV